MDSFLPMMLESDDSDLEDGPDVVRHKTKIIYQNHFPYIHMEPPDILYERWGKINLELRQKTGYMLHISAFWWHILFRQQENHVTTSWAVEVGFLDANFTNDLSLKRLHKIEILELILNTIENCLSDTEPERKAKELISLSTSFQLQEDCLVKAVSWLEEFGPPGLSRKLLDLGPKKIRYHILHFIFIEYARYIQVMSCSKKKMTKDVLIEPDPWNLQKSEEMKNKGNEQFQKKKYDQAVKWYTKAIKFHPSNHLLYGNRALSYLRCEKYLKAMGDGKRAIILQRDWAKGHYRFCDALFFLGAKDKAIEANLRAQKYCSADPEGIRDLQQQYSRFMTETYEGKAEGKQKKAETKKGASKRHEAASGLDPSIPHVSSYNDTVTSLESCTLENKTEDAVEQQEPPGRSRNIEENCKSAKDDKSEMGDRKTKNGVPCIPEKQAVRAKPPPAQENAQTSGSNACSKKQFCAAVVDAHTALADQRCHNAEQAFSLALHVLQSSGSKCFGITELDKALLIYGYATALLEIGQPEELTEAKRQFDKLRSSEDRKFQSLVHYGIGKVFLKENRYPKAFEEFSNALLMVQRQITPGKLTWPTTKVTVEETRPEYLKEQLERYIELCKFPPKPDAICRHQHCLGHAIEIYFTDPDFKGFIRITCCQSCHVEFHINCWKKLKAASFADKNDKDFLQDGCFTPDCSGRICHIVIFGSTGLIKCKFESTIPKNKPPVRLRVKQKCTSLKKLKSKEDRKQRRKQMMKVAASVTKAENDLTSEEDKDHRETQKASPKDYIVYEDRVLRQIHESRELFRDEIINISTMLMCLRPWMELDKAKGHAIVQAEPNALMELVDLLLEVRNRVWARLFVHKLCDCQNIKPKVHNWAQQLESAGLKAAEKFIDCYGDRLEELDLTSLLTFSPLQDILIEKFGTIPELFDNTGLTVIDYLRQAPPQEMRLFIWTLEEHRESYPTCTAALDEYFEMDGIRLVIKKTENDKQLTSLYKSKSKNRRKKQKEPKSVIVLSGMRSGLLRDEEDEDIFSEDDSLMLLDGTDPFSVPEHLREQVAEFEGQYYGSGRLNHYKKFLDNSADRTKESLYDYFAQILEEHGPLHASDPLFVGELENFPIEAHQKIDAAGGLEAFLLESLRFVMTDNLIGLTKHAVSLQHNVADEAITDCFSQIYNSENIESQRSSHLNPTAKEFLPQFECFSLSDNNASYDGLGLCDDADIQGLVLSESHNTLPGPCRTLPDPYDFSDQISHNFAFTSSPQDMDMFGTLNDQEDNYPNPEYLLNTSLKDCIYNSTALTSGISEINVNIENERGQTLLGNISDKVQRPENKTVSVQTLGYNKNTKDDVAVNTEPYTLFEKNKGDMTQKEKNSITFEKRIQNMKDTLEILHQQRKEKASVLEAEVKEIQHKIEITKTELSLFQQKLEEEIRKDQQEKRDNQETLKTLKGEIKELEDLRESYSKQIQDKNVEFKTELNHFLEKSNQSAAEKMSLEDEIKRCRDLCAKATSQSLTAQLSVLQNRREVGLRGLRKCVLDGKAILQNMTEVSTRYPSGGLVSTIEAWKSCVQEAEQKIAITEAQYEEQVEQVKRGTRLCSLSPVSVPSAPAPPPVPAFLHALPSMKPVPQQFPVRHMTPHAQYGAHQQPVRSQTYSAVNRPPIQPAERAPHTLPAPSAPMTLTEAPQRPPAPLAPAAPRAPTPVQQHLGVFDKIVDRLHSMFPHYSRPVIGKFIQEVRTANGNTLNMLTYEDVINRAAQLILDHQEGSREQISSVGGDPIGVRESAVPSPTPVDSYRASPTPLPVHVWKSVSSHHRSSSKALNMEDPCIICHDDMAPEELCVLECRHSFHRECIKSWLKEQSTCPTCREHALLPEDFPMLPGRHRRGHAPAASFS